MTFGNLQDVLCQMVYSPLVLSRPSSWYNACRLFASRIKPDGTLPADNIPAGTLPADTIPVGTKPAGTLPAD